MTGDIGATISKAREHSIGDLLRRSAGREPTRLAVSCGSVSWTLRRDAGIRSVTGSVAACSVLA